MPAIDWFDAEDTKRQIIKILGSKAKLPDDSKLKHTEEQLKKSYATFLKIAHELRKAIPAYETALEHVDAAYAEYSTECSKSDFGLNAKDPKDQKNIDAARKVVTKNAKEANGFSDISLKSIKKMMQLTVNEA